MKMGHCKIVAVSFIVMVQLWSIAPVMACHYCPPALKPPTAPVLSPPKTPTPTVPYTPTVPPSTPTVPSTPTPTVPYTPTVPPYTPTVPPSAVPPSAETCPLDTLKLGACADVLGGLVHLVIGDPSVNKCCPVLQGVLGIEAALCLCTTIKLNLLNLNIALPLALELLVTCGINPPSGFTCPTT